MSLNSPAAGTRVQWATYSSLMAAVDCYCMGKAFYLYVKNCSVLEGRECLKL